MAKNRYDMDEEYNQKADLKCLKSLGKYIKPHTKILVISAFLVFGIAGLEMLPPYFIQIVLDHCIPKKDYNTVFILTGILIAAAVLLWYFLKKKVQLTHIMALDAIKTIRSDVFRHIQHLPFSYFDSRPHGKILVRVVNYVNTLTSMLANGIMGLITDFFKLVVILGFMLAMDVEFTLICLAGIPVFLGCLIVLKRIHKRAWNEYSQKQSNLNAYLQESINGIKITQSFAREETNSKIFNGLCTENKKKWIKARSIALGIPMSVTILSITVTLIIYAVGFYKLQAGEIKIGMLIAFAAYVSNFWQPIINSTNIYNEIINCAVYLERIFDTMNEPEVVFDKEGATELGKIEGNLSFKNVTFRYEEDTPNILENLSFDVKQGETIAFVGPTGAGKSTVINLISRFYNLNEGEITIDGKNIADVTLNSLRSQMGIMLQDSFLFSGTIMDNIRYSKLDATDEEVIEAAKAVCADKFISELPDGYKTMVREGGSGLSAGQKQLIAFARTLLCDPAILILDEATSSIDTETEIDLQKGLEQLLKGRTSFVIAHRLSTIKNSSRIMYVANKTIEECGTHDELLEKQGKYHSLYMAQYKFLEQL